MERSNKQLLEDLEKTVAQVTIKEKEIIKLNEQLVANKVKTNEQKSLEEELLKVSSEKAKLVQQLQAMTSQANATTQQLNKTDEQVKELKESAAAIEARANQSITTIAEQKATIAEITSMNKNLQAQVALIAGVIDNLNLPRIY